ncbi:MAG: SRPBCC family protein [Micropruina sp.]
MTTFSVMVGTRLPAEVVFDYLSNPANRPAWQSSLAAVIDVVGDGEEGSSWVDLTKVGLRAELVVTAHQRPYRWVERGTWRGFVADLELAFDEHVDGTRITALVGFRAPWWLAPVPPLLGLIAPDAVRADLARALELCSAQQR